MALQMTWQPTLHRRKSGPLGLQNLGNTCYLNSVLQCLTYTPPLANFCLKNQHSSLCESLSKADNRRDCPFCILERRIVRSLSIEAPLDAPTKIQNSLRIFAEHFRFGRQEDAHEFLRYVIDACHNTCLKLFKEGLKHQRNGGVVDPLCHDTVVKQIFGGALQSQVKCLSCGAESNRTDEIMDISLDLFQSSSLREALRRFFQPEVLDGSNKYNCEKCRKLSPARKQMSVLQAPNILVIQLKRFEGIGGKIDRPIAFEEVLTLTNYMSKGSQDTRPEYNLFGSIVHSGYSPESGHYYAYIKDASGRWYCCNDSHVSLANLEEVLSEKVYILFFCRANQRPKTATKSNISGFASNGGVKSVYCNGNGKSVDEGANQRPKTATKSNISGFASNGGVKSAYCNGNGKSVDEGATVPSKPTVPRTYGPELLLNIPPKQRTSNLKLPETNKRVDANGNGILKAVYNSLSSVGSHDEQPKETVGMKKMKVPSISDNSEESKISKKKAESSSVFDGKNISGGKGPSDVMDNGSQKTYSLPEKNGNISKSTDVNSEEVWVSESDNGTGNMVAESRKYVPSHVKHLEKGDCNAGYSKRKFQDIEEAEIPIALSKSSGEARKNDSSNSDLDRFKQVLVKDASSELRSCGWADEVQNFMCEKKRLHVQGTGNVMDLRRMLIADAKQTFISQIPEALKEDLIGRLRLFCKEKMLTDS
ncbi:ubiquitin carboxyl-terminal hydrolase 25-like [Aristolochia californica]|uniref:ubiquitin carboxyl-terminal hydrolase 25-like n=1 Tax=Aristolochia californica TaxID=171875 RepID=UPI0035E2DCE3